MSSYSDTTLYNYSPERSDDATSLSTLPTRSHLCSFWTCDPLARIANDIKKKDILPLFVNVNAHYKISQFYRRTHSVGVWLEVRRWFIYRRHHRRNMSVTFPFIGDSPFHRYISRENKKTICRWFYRRNLRAKKKNDSRLKYTDGFLFRWWYHALPTGKNRW